MKDLIEIINNLPLLIQYVYPGFFILWIVKVKILFRNKIEFKSEFLYIISISYIIVEICKKNNYYVILLTLLLMIIIFAFSSSLLKFINKYFNYGTFPNLLVESANDFKDSDHNTYVKLELNDGTVINGGLIGVDDTEHPEYIVLNLCNELDDRTVDERMIIKLKDCKLIEFKKCK